jgi:hypothetical protein
MVLVPLVLPLMVLATRSRIEPYYGGGMIP